ncbi:MAG: aldo/keto reductase [Clostridiales bacterium]|nr:aldo/keto reductase [Clostridiales bacterium]
MKKLGFGCMRLPVIDGDQSRINIEEFKKMVDLFQSRGFSYYDTAYVYHNGKSEEAVREAVVKRYPRNAFTVTTKMPMMKVETEQDLVRIFDEQLERLGVDYIDYYWLHALNVKQYEKVQRLKAFEFILKKKAEGKIKHIGFSFHDTPELLEKILSEHPETEYVQLQINYIDWDSPSICGRECYEIATRHNKPVIVMEPVKGGALAKVPEAVTTMFKNHRPDMSVASWAVRFAASPENILTVLSGMSDMEQVDDNTAYMQDFKPLDSEEQALVALATNVINDSTVIPCTACRYCVDGCPKKIAIPDFFTLFNEHKRVNGMSDAPYYYNNVYGARGGKPSECVQCGKCEKICPQHLQIRNHLKEVTAAFETK